MAAGEYLKSAASSLHQAAGHLRQQSKDLQASVAKIRADRRTLIDKDAVQIKTTQIEAAAINDKGQQSRLAKQIEKLQQEIMAAEKELQRSEKELIDAANAKIDAAIGIENQAKQLESQATQID